MWGRLGIVQYHRLLHQIFFLLTKVLGVSEKEGWDGGVYALSQGPGCRGVTSAVETGAVETVDRHLVKEGEG